MLAGLLLWPSAACAEWLKAESDRFIVYGTGSEAQVRGLVTRLSAYDAVLRLLNPGARDDPPSQKFEVYLARGAGDLRRVRPGLPGTIRGFYSANENAVFAMAMVTHVGLTTDETLFHEYAHYFMHEHFPAAYPAWFVEGWAEYYMTTDIGREKVTVGEYNENRVYWLYNAEWLPMETVLSKGAWQVDPNRTHLFYSQAWLLTHYLRSDPARAVQLNKAIAAIAAGEDPVSAMRAATGMSMAELTKALRGYRQLPAHVISGLTIHPPQITVIALTRSADDFLLDNLRLSDGSPDKADPGFLADVRRRAARWPGDRLAELTLARAEFLYGDLAVGEAIMKRRLEADPKDVEALLVAGVGQLMAGQRDPANRRTRLKAARAFLIPAYKLDDTDYRILLAYTLSRALEPGYPNGNDLKALLEARALAPSVQLSSVLAGSAFLQRGEPARAAVLLAAAANNPHGGAMAAQARALLAGKSLDEAQKADADPDHAPTDDPPKPGPVTKDKAES